MALHRHPPRCAGVHPQPSLSALLKEPHSLRLAPLLGLRPPSLHCTPLPIEQSASQSAGAPSGQLLMYGPEKLNSY